MGALTKRAVLLGRGAVAGTLATMAMKGVMSLLESKKKMRISDAFSDQKPAEREVIDRLNKRYKWKLSRSRRAMAAQGLHWGIGVTSGIAGSYLSRQMGAKGHPIQAAAFSVMTFVVIDELIKPLIGVRPKPAKVPFQTHAAALAGQAAYGLVNAGTEQVMENVLPREYGRT